MPGAVEAQPLSSTVAGAQLVIASRPAIFGSRGVMLDVRADYHRSIWRSSAASAPASTTGRGRGRSRGIVGGAIFGP